MSSLMLFLRCCEGKSHDPLPALRNIKKRNTQRANGRCTRESQLFPRERAITLLPEGRESERECARTHCFKGPERPRARPLFSSQRPLGLHAGAR